MSGIHRFTAVHEARKALVEAARVALEDEPIDIGLGFRWPLQEDDWFAVVDADSVIDPANLGTRRQVQEVITLDVSIGAWRSGYTEETEIEAADRAFDILRRVQEHVRLNDITLGGTVLWCLPGGLQTAGATDERDSHMGRLTEIAAQFVCEHRIR